MSHPTSVIRKHLVDHAALPFGLGLVGVVAGDGDQRLPQRPAAAARPSGVIDGNVGAKSLAAFAFEERPGYSKIAGWIADAGGAEIDDGAQAAVLDQQIARGDIAMEPDRGAKPGVGKRCFPDGGRGLGVDPAIKRGDGLPCLVVIDRQRPATVEIMLAGCRPIRHIDASQRDEEIGERDCEGVEIVDARTPGRLAVNPAINRPMPGIALGRLAHGQRRWNGQRQEGCQFRQPAMLLLDLQRIGGSARQPDRHFVAKMEGAVVPAAESDRADRQMPPFRELSIDQPAHGIDGYLWIGHVAGPFPVLLRDRHQWGNSSPISR